MTTYPLTLPDGFEVEDASFGLLTSVGSSVSPFSYGEQVYLHSGARWGGDVSLRPYKDDSAGEIKAFLTRLKGVYGTFYYADPYYYAAGPAGVADGSPLVDGASQTGNTLNVKSAPAGRQGWLLAGRDYIQLGTGTSSRLHMITEDAHVAADGTVALSIEPDLRSSPADNAAIVCNGARGVFRLDGNQVEWSVSDGVVQRITFSFHEALNV